MTYLLLETPHGQVLGTKGAGLRLTVPIKDDGSLCRALREPADFAPFDPRRLRPLLDSKLVQTAPCVRIQAYVTGLHNFDALDWHKDSVTKEHKWRRAHELEVFGKSTDVINNIYTRLPSLQGSTNDAGTKLYTTQWHECGAGIGGDGSNTEKRHATTTIEQNVARKFDMEGASSFLGKLWVA